MVNVFMNNVKTTLKREKKNILRWTARLFVATVILVIVTSFEPVANLLDQFNVSETVEFLLALALFSLFWVGFFYVLIKFFKWVLKLRNVRR